MIKKFLTIFLTALTINSGLAQNASANVVTWNSPEGIKRLESSKFKNDFYQLANFYQPQINPIYCSAATGTAILNALNYNRIRSQKSAEVTSPEGKLIPFNLYLQSNFFNKRTDRIKNREIINLKAKNDKGNYDPGLSLKDFSRILRRYGLTTKTTYVKSFDEESIMKFRKIVKKTLSENKKFIAINFNGRVIGNKTGGHISTLGAYHEESDSILVLDVALHKNIWYFVSLEELYKAMNTKDDDQYRGYLIVSK